MRAPQGSQAWSLKVFSHVQRWRPVGPALISHVWPLTPRRADLLEVSRSQRARSSFNSSRSEGALCSRPTAGYTPTTLESQFFSGDCGSLQHKHTNFHLSDESPADGEGGSQVMTSETSPDSVFPASQ